MTLRVKNIIYTLGLLSAMFLVWHYRSDKTEQMIWVTGKTMGPITYNVKYFDNENRNFKVSIDSLLRVFNQSLNTYIPASEISQFNSSNSFEFKLPFFYEALDVSKNIYESTDGAFDPSIGPLINAWGFGPEDGFKPDSAYIDSVKQFVGFEKLTFDKNKVEKSDGRINISFSASAKGYGVDVVADFLADKGIKNYYVEIGGEGRALGKNITANQPWTVGILHPNSEEISPYFYAISELTNRAMATSGNYFNYHLIDGVKFGHTIDPTSGYPIQHRLLSATVFASTCHEADALATAFMVMGLEGAKQYLKSKPDVGGFLIYSTEEGDLMTYQSNTGLIKKVE